MLRARIAVLSLSVVSAFGAVLQTSVRDDRSGQPVVSAELRVSKAGVRELLADLESDSDGRFEPLELLAGDYVLNVTKVNHIETSLRLQIGSTPQKVAFRLVRCGTISGRVADQTGQPVYQAAVLALNAGDHVRLQTLTDSNGAYRLCDLKPGRYRIAVAYGQSTSLRLAAGLPSSPSSLGSGVVFSRDDFVVTSGDEYRDVNFMIISSPVFRVRGSVETDDVGTFWIALTSAEHPEVAIAVAMTAPDHSFHFEGIPAGSYNIFVSGPSSVRGPAGAILGEGVRFARSQFSVIGGDIDGLRLHPAPSLSLPIVVHADPGCSQRMQVSAEPLEDWGTDLSHSIEASANHVFSMTALAPARYRLYVRSADGLCYPSTEVVADLSAGVAQLVRLTLEHGGSVQVHVRGSRPLVLLGHMLTRMAVPDANSEIEFNDLPPGRYRLALAEGMPANVRELDVRAGSIQRVEMNATK